ncbi:MTG-like gene family protein [Alphaentomopoxvirus acuprea]|uniref:MTG-like gene family protein n=1 Tax=Alphaentomopoxvirus acuprea TaxID=62099 RepID=W6JJ51_9POXV|nr:MTG-like gene family protein [Anomala cuprea entomopoxvirus]YP_009001735.1 MTG-like gene family protein [Anomala cuprea entomopoxvirus]BAO49362.1 MTG-like gene family protein [Anomala cuprea entomopoxvirus]BAO49622.1 MTG-like gene family protein [Anomala cuprea entomopoxvirus]
MTYNLKKLCNKYNIEFDKEKLINSYKNHLINIDNNIIYINEDGLVKFYVDYNITPKLLTIFEYINKHYDLKLDTWFYDIWLPLFEEKDVLITDNILKFIHYGINISGCGVRHPDFKQIKHHLKQSLNNYNIQYIEIKYNDIRINEYEYVKNDIKKISPNNLVQKYWILLPIRNFKSLLMRLDTKGGHNIREYYITLEEIFYNYSKYISKHNLKLEKINSLQYKQKIEHLERSNLQIRNFIDNVK